MKKVVDTLFELIETAPQLHVGYISKNEELANILEDEFKQKDINFTFIKADQSGKVEITPRIFEYVIIENIKEIQQAMENAYNSLESIGLAIFIEQNPIDIWSLTEELSECKLSNPAHIELENGYSIVTSKKLLSS